MGYTIMHPCGIWCFMWTGCKIKPDCDHEIKCWNEQLGVEGILTELKDWT